jgi:hypothetical protein
MENVGEYLNEIRILKQLALNLYKKKFKIDNKVLGSCETIQNNIKTKNCSLFCNKYLKDDDCVWNNNGVCKFAHNFEDLDETKKIKILELGLQAYYYIYNIKKEKSTKYSFFDYIKYSKKSENLYMEEVESLSIIKEQYNKLHNHILKLKNEYEFHNELFPFQLKNHCDYISNSNIFNCKEIDDIKLKLNEYIGCKICYKSIVDIDDNIYNEEGKMNKNHKFVSLSCGHSICEQCHINMINSKTTIFINCPICRNDNKLEETKPNYELNEQIFKIKTLIKMFRDMFNKFEGHIENFNKKVFFNKSNSKINNKLIKNIIKSNEAPW